MKCNPGHHFVNSCKYWKIKIGKCCQGSRGVGRLAIYLTKQGILNFTNLTLIKMKTFENELLNEKISLTETQQLVLNYFENENNENSNAELVVSSIPSLNKLVTLKTLKILTDKGLLLKSDSTPATYSIAKTLSVRSRASDEKNEKEITECEEELKPKSGGRNTDKFIFKKQSYSKSRLVLEVLKSFIADHPNYTLEEIQNTWKSDELQKRYGTIVEVSKAKKFCEGDRERHFMKDVLTVGSKRVVVSNQWSETLLIGFLEIADSLKYRIAREQH